MKTFSDTLLSGQLGGGSEVTSGQNEIESMCDFCCQHIYNRQEGRLALGWKCGLMPSHVSRVRGM